MVLQDFFEQKMSEQNYQGLRMTEHDLKGLFKMDFLV